MASNPWTAESLCAEIEAFLALHHTITLSTVADNGDAHAASLLYAPEGLAIFWTSDADTRHSRHIAARPKVAATIAPDYRDFRAIRGLQIEGEACRLEVEDAARALLIARYSFLAQLASAPVALLAAWRKAAFYRLAPTRITLIDNTRGFGHKATLVIGFSGNISIG
ncbi:MAG TPA: pyridoxamine 5'-phosphate oxidase family protein [Candidatus Binataceae bacterium]|nr:pyridoxamine 5'-phosphate oxidase family protein [Candidatus Binataceae bacterium]